MHTIKLQTFLVVHPAYHVIYVGYSIHSDI